MGVAQNIAALLAKFEISQNAFAETIDVNPATVSRWRNGSMSIRQSTVDRICEIYDLVPDDILSDHHGLAAQMFGTPPRAFTVPLVQPDELAAYMAGELAEPREHIAVTVDVHELHPRAFALPVPDEAMNLLVPLKAHAIVDPDAPPHDESTVLVTTHLHSGATLRKLLARDDGTAVLTAQSTEPFDDIPLARDEAGPARVVGTVVWFQSSHMMD